MGEIGDLKKLLRKVDQAITGHSILRDRYSGRSTVLNLVLLVLSAVITFMAFASKATVEAVFPEFLQNEHALPIFALLMFVITIVEVRVGWKEKSASHGEAANALSSFKHELQKAIGESAGGLEVARFFTNYQYVNSSITKIPDSEFLQLKKAHKKKVEICVLLDQYPGASITLLKVKVFLRDNFGANFLREGEKADGNGSKQRTGETKQSS